nr:peptidase M1 [Algoriphagus sp.]
MKPLAGLFLCLISGIGVFAQTGRFQQAVDYQMEVSMDVKTNRYTGTQVLTYTNNSPDTLNRVFYHLYYNAFQPGSMMDVRSRTIADPDRRVGDRISLLTPEEIGYLHVKSLTKDGKAVKFNEEETILVVDLDQPILPNSKATFEMAFE